MKVLLVGEFSGFYSNLKNGLLELGVDAWHAGAGKNWGNSDYDFQLMPKFKNKMADKIYRQTLPCINLNKIKNYDIVQFVNSAILGVLNPFNPIAGKYLIDSSGRFYLSAAGDDPYYFAARNNLRYNPLDDAKKIDFKGRKLSIEYPWPKRWAKQLAETANGVIPVAYDYAQAYRGINNINLRKTIPLPINLKIFDYVGCCEKKRQKIKVFHGINRAGYKGTNYIKKAFEILRSKYYSKAEFIIGEPMAFNEYIDYLKDIDIVVDQSNSYSSGMNGIIAMALGKVVLSGAEPESLKEFEVEHSPLINITPDVNFIVEKISSLIDSEYEYLRDVGKQSRIFAELNHCHIKVASKYMEEWCVK